MSTEANFDEQSYQRASDIATTAWLEKEGCVDAPELQKFDLEGYVEATSVGGRLRFIEEVGDKLAFSPEKIMAGIIAGDFVED